MGTRSWSSKKVPDSSQRLLLEESHEEYSRDPSGNQNGSPTRLDRQYRQTPSVIPGHRYNHPPIGGGWPEGGGKCEKKSNYSEMLCIPASTCHRLSPAHGLRVSDPLESASLHSRLFEHALIMKSVQNDCLKNLPHQVAMPDGEEKPPGSFTHAQIRCSNQENELLNPCVRAPPNQQVFRDTSSPPSRSHSCGALEEEKGSSATSGFKSFISSLMNSKPKGRETHSLVSKVDKGNQSRNRCSSMSGGREGKKSPPISPTKSHLIPTPMCVYEHSSAPAMCVQVPCKSRAGVKRSPVLRTDSRTFPNSASNTANTCACLTGSFCVHSSQALNGRQACDNITNSEHVVQSSASVKLASLPVVPCFIEAEKDSPENRPMFK